MLTLNQDDQFEGTGYIYRHGKLEKVQVSPREAHEDYMGFHPMTFEGGIHTFGDFFYVGKYKDPFAGADISEAITGGRGRTLMDFLEIFNKRVNLAFHFPVMDKRDPDLCYIWPNLSALKKGESGRTQIKFGKMLRLVFPTYTDAERERVHQNWRDSQAERQLTVHIGKTRGDFAKGYSTAYAKEVYQDFGEYTKSLVCSCMRYDAEFFCRPDTDGNFVHPAEFYASGDFTIIYCTTPDGKLTGRCVVYTAETPIRPAPIYTTDRKTLDTIRAEITKLNGGSYGWEFGESWEGARVLSIESEGCLIGAYSDQEPKELTEGSGGYLIFDSYGEMAATSTGGDISDSGSARGMQLCESCESYEPEEDFFYVQTRWGETPVCSSCRDYHYYFCEDTQEYCEESKTITCETVDGSTVTITNTCEELFNCVWSSDLYYDPDRKMFETTDGEYVHPDALDNGWTLNDDGLAVSPEEQAESNAA